MRRYYLRRLAAKTAALAPPARNSRGISDIFMRFSKLATHLWRYKSNNGIIISNLR
jgi:hypothetical protein